MTMMTNYHFNSLDLAEVLQEEGYGIDEDSGEVYTDPESKRDLLIILASLGKLNVGRGIDADDPFKLSFTIPYWNCYNSFEGYCKQFPHEQQCKCYDV